MINNFETPPTPCWCSVTIKNDSSHAIIDKGTQSTKSWPLPSPNIDLLNVQTFSMVIIPCHHRPLKDHNLAQWPFVGNVKNKSQFAMLSLCSKFLPMVGQIVGFFVLNRYWIRINRPPPKSFKSILSNQIGTYHTPTKCFTNTFRIDPDDE